MSALTSIHDHTKLWWNPYLPEQQYNALDIYMSMQDLKGTEDELTDIYMANWGFILELTRLAALSLDVLAEALEELQLSLGLD